MAGRPRKDAAVRRWGGWNCVGPGFRGRTLPIRSTMSEARVRNPSRVRAVLRYARHGYPDAFTTTCRTFLSDRPKEDAMPDTLTEQDRALVCARLSEAAYGATDNEYRTSASALGFNVETIFHDGQTETRGMLVYNATTKVLALVFRGTVASFLMQNLSTDLWQESEQLALNKDPNVRVIQGFARAWRTIAGAVAAAVNQKLTAIGGPGVLTAFYFTGHSLGGALATYASLEIGTMLERKYNFRNSLVVRVITIA